MTEGLVPLIQPLEHADEPSAVCARFLDLPYLLFLDSTPPTRSLGEAQPLQQFSFLTADPWTVVRSKGRSSEIRRQEDDRWRPATGDALSVARGLLPIPPPHPMPAM